MDIILVPLLNIILLLIGFYVNIIFFAVIFSWLIAFGVLKNNNRYVYLIGNFFYAVTEPIYSRIRRHIPTFSGIDFSPLVVILALIFLQEVIVQVISKLS